MYNEDDFLKEREKLFNEVWNEPMTTVAKRYGLSDNGLRKRCIKLDIPLPPVGHWAKLQAGKESVPKPKLPPMKIIKQTIIDEDKKHVIEFEDICEKTDSELESADVMGLLTPESKEKFIQWCQKIQVPKKIDNYSQLINEYQKEIEYRKARDKEHVFHENFRYTEFYWTTHYKTPYRVNVAILPITVSEKQSSRALRIMDTLISSVSELGGKVYVNRGDKDNATFTVFNHDFSFYMNEIMIKRREKLLKSNEGISYTEFKPMYEKQYSGLLKIDFTELSDNRAREKSSQSLHFQDSLEEPLEKQFGEVFISLFKIANEAAIARYIAEREYEKRIKEEQRLREIEAENLREKQRTEARNQRRIKFNQNIDRHIDEWFKYQNIKKYINDLNEHLPTITDLEEKEILADYLLLLRDKAEKANPINNVIKEIRLLKDDES
ncbi:hypothetical protein LY28_02787 [Ruminiclostridium sufflavum DSM 19573]|uniref:Uncharacterized protein n=1 Tax=Ruminiclostridium sufflavum DSM 19573 TaxID=1121337 RepID=A0A318Y3Z6_9FIRM|nr:hypothetical protein [Ruminiclostridium sufflavum]PYG86761.1 hypothetical protein LY28_02787 [Ruminiclostridium sufflavum DSM 19573]